MPSKKSAAKVLRRDVYAFNSSSVMLLASRSQLGQGHDTDSKEWKKLCAAGQILAVDFGQDASIYLRVIVGDPLAEQERAEWVGRLVTRLQVPDGQLVVVGGIELAIEEQDPDEIEDGGDVRVLAIPAGDYRAELYAQVTAPIGEDLLARASKKRSEPLGAWCRRTRPGRDFPAWLRSRCSDEPELDPGHENEWRGLRVGEAETVQFVLHLTPVSATPPAAATIDEFGFVAAESFEVRRPELCPFGLAPVELLGKESSQDEEDDDEGEDEATGRAPVGVRERVEKFALSAIAGEPILLPATALTQAARLGWFGRDVSHPELRIELPAGADVSGWPRIPYASVAKTAGAITVSFEFPGGGNPFVWELGERGALEAVGKLVARLPEGCVLELTCARPGGAPVQADEPGVLRLRGPLAASGWSIRESFPAVPAARWKAALALSAEVDKGKSLALEAGEVTAISEWADEASAYLFDDNLLTVKGKKATLEEASTGLLGTVARQVFRLRFADTWPVDED